MLGAAACASVLAASGLPARVGAFSSPWATGLYRGHSNHLQLSAETAGASKSSTPAADDGTGADAAQPRSQSQSSPPRSSASSAQPVKTGVGRWEEMAGNYLLRPPPDLGQPRALLHFLGGAIVGAAPDVTYRYLLEELAQEGYLIVATPYNLSFNHLQTCDEVINKFERVAPSLAQQYGAIPVVGVGHSCGALLHLLVTSLFPDTPRAANALLSFNNKPVQEAVPLFSEVVAPLFTSLAGGGGNETAWPSGTEAIQLGLGLVRSAARGEIPSDEALTDVLRFALPIDGGQQVAVPKELRDAARAFAEPAALALEGAGVLPLIDQGIDILQQVPLLVDEVADGAQDFVPPPSAVRAAARRAYRARRTLLIQYDNDPLDESEEMEDLLQEAETVMRMKRPMIAFDIQRKVLKGGHAAPLLAPPVDLATKLEDVLGEEIAKERLLYKEADATVKELVKWLDVIS